MSEPSPTPHPLLLMVMIFSILTLVGAVLLVVALMGSGGVLVGIIGALQTFVCAAMLGAAVRRWRAAR